jgi:hypothetical protein
MAAELKDARNKLASQERLFARELEARKVGFILYNWEVLVLFVKHWKILKRC